MSRFNSKGQEIFRKACGLGEEERHMEHQEGIIPFTLAKEFGHGSNELTKRNTKRAHGWILGCFLFLQGPCCLFHGDDVGFMVFVDFSPSFADFPYLRFFACFCSLRTSLL
uniref:Uncharacterized protein n=1 Tax=Bionectria ochroleuca TaxID=29856 RepID=A0A8H7NNH2_BIOOC